MNELTDHQMSMPGRLKGMLAVLVFQSLANGFIGFVVLDAVSTQASHGARVDGAGAAYFFGYLGIAIAVLLLACAVLTPLRQAWIRPTVITIEAIGVLGGVINLVSGQVTAIAAIAIAIGVIATFNRDDIRDWYTGRAGRGEAPHGLHPVP